MMSMAAFGKSISRPLPTGLIWRASERVDCDRLASMARFA